MTKEEKQLCSRMQGQWHDRKRMCRLKGINTPNTAAGATRVNREAQKNEEQQGRCNYGQERLNNNVSVKYSHLVIFYTIG